MTLCPLTFIIQVSNLFAPPSGIYIIQGNLWKDLVQII